MQDIQEAGLNKQMILVFGTLVGAAILVFIMFFLTDALAVGQTYTETFEVDDSSVNQTLDLAHTPADGNVDVDQYTGVGWEDVSGTYVTVNEDIVSVDKDGMY